MEKWYLIYCKPGQDSRAELNLARQGFKVFRPTIKVVKERIGRSDTVRCESLFPRYVFIQVDPHTKSIAPAMSTYGVANFVKFGNRFAVAPDQLISEIVANVDTQIYLQEQRDRIKHGDEIYLNGHGFDQVRAIYCNPVGSQRAMILLNILGKEAKISVPTECISRQARY